MELGVGAEGAGEEAGLDAGAPGGEEGVGGGAEGGVEADGAAEEDEGEIEDEGDVVDGGGEEVGGGGEDGVGEGVAGEGVVEDFGGLEVLGERGGGGGPAGLPLGFDAFAAEEGFEAAGFAAGWWFGGGVGEEHVADFAGGPGHAAEGFVVEDDAGADAGADGEEDEVGGALGGAGGGFAEGGEFAVVVDGGGDVEGVLEELAEGDVAPAEEVGGDDDNAGVDVGDAGGAGGDGF